MPSSPEVMRANTVLYCREFRAVVEFYRDGLEFPVTFENDWFVEMEACPGARVSVADASRATVPSAGGAGLTLTLMVADADAARARLVERGLDPEPARDHPWGARLFHLRDPEGNRVEFWSETTGP